MAARLRLFAALLALALLLLLLPGKVLSATFTVRNSCGYTVWPGILSSAGTAPLSTTGFVLQPGESKAVDVPSSWSGRFWGRSYCATDSAGKFSCATGDCASGEPSCKGNNAMPPATLAEFTLNGAGGLDFFDVSLVDGYNLPMLVAPQGGGGGGNCTSTGCVVDLNGACPSALRVLSSDGRQGVACKSACEAFGKPEYCCSGAYGGPDTCKPSSYSQIFKNACPRAYSYAYDDKTSTFTCASADYTITFCPSPNTSQKSASGGQGGGVGGEGGVPTGSGTPGSPTINSAMVYEGALQTSGAFPVSTCSHVQIMAGAVAAATALWRLCQQF